MFNLPVFKGLCSCMNRGQGGRGGGDFSNMFSHKCYLVNYVQSVKLSFVKFVKQLLVQILSILKVES